MSNNIFSGKRLQMLFKQHFIHNSQLLLLSAVAYMGVIFIVLCLTQIGDDLHPHNLNNFEGFLIAAVTVFGILYVGHSFPAFRSKESTIHYLMLPASALEKFVFEFIIRIVLALLVLPLLYWVTFNIQGYFFQMFTDEYFTSVGIQHLVTSDEIVPEYAVIIYTLITGGVLFVLSVAFTGAAMFTKQPLVRSLFTVALVVIIFLGYSYIVVEHVGVGRYNPPDDMWLVPLEEDRALILVSIALFAGTVVMLFVAFLKLKEREV